MMSGPPGTEIFISSDMFFLEVLLEPSGLVRDVKIHHEGKSEQQVSTTDYCDSSFLLLSSFLLIILKIVFAELRGPRVSFVARRLRRFHHATRRIGVDISAERR